MKNPFPLSYGYFVAFDHPKIRVPIPENMISRVRVGDYAIAPEHGLYLKALYALRLRYEVCEDNENIFRISYQKLQIHSHDPGELDVQNKALYAFFSNAYSFYESYCFMMFMLGSIIKRNDELFNIDERKITHSSTLKAFLKNFPNEDLTTNMNKILQSKNFRYIKRIRNILNHCINPHRRVLVGVDPRNGGKIIASTEYLDGIGLKESEPRKLHEKYLSTYLNALTSDRDQLLDAYMQFIEKYFPSKELRTQK